MLQHHIFMILLLLILMASTDYDAVSRTHHPKLANPQIVNTFQRGTRVLLKHILHVECHSSLTFDVSTQMRLAACGFD